MQKGTLETVLTDVVECERCWGYHPNLVFTKFEKGGPMNSYWSHWALCPSNYEPILLRWTYVKRETGNTG